MFMGRTSGALVICVYAVFAHMHLVQTIALDFVVRFIQGEEPIPGKETQSIIGGVL